jgi:hypothetical protein
VGVTVEVDVVDDEVDALDDEVDEEDELVVVPAARTVSVTVPHRRVAVQTARSWRPGPVAAGTLARAESRPLASTVPAPQRTSPALTVTSPQHHPAPVSSTVAPGVVSVGRASSVGGRTVTIALVHSLASASFVQIVSFAGPAGASTGICAEPSSPNRPFDATDPTTLSVAAQTTFHVEPAKQHQLPLSFTVAPGRTLAGSAVSTGSGAGARVVAVVVLVVVVGTGTAATGAARTPARRKPASVAPTARRAITLTPGQMRTSRLSIQIRPWRPKHQLRHRDHAM